MESSSSNDNWTVVCKKKKECAKKMQNIENIEKTNSKKLKRGGKRIRISQLLRDAGYKGIISRKLLDELSGKNGKNGKKIEEDIEEDMIEVLGRYFDPKNLLACCPDGYKCTSEEEKTFRLNQWWSRLLGYNVY